MLTKKCVATNYTANLYGTGNRRQEVQALSGTMTTCDLNGAEPVPNSFTSSYHASKKTGASTGRDLVRAFPLSRRRSGESGNQASRRRASSHLDTYQSFDIHKVKKDSARKRNQKIASRYEAMAETQSRLTMLLAEVCRISDEAIRPLAEKVSSKLRRCHKEFAAVYCRNSSCPINRKNIQPMFACKYRACPYCAEIRRDTAFSKKLPILRAYAEKNPKLKPVLITLTQKNEGHSLQRLVHEFKKSISKLKRTIEFKRRILAAVVTYECPVNESTGNWHLHCHILAFRTTEYWNRQNLSHLWAKANGGKSSSKFGAHIRSVSSLTEGLNEVLKYIYKPADVRHWTYSHVLQLLELHRIKMSEMYGGLRGIKVEKEERQLCEESQNGECCKCGGNDIYEECCEPCSCGSGNEFRYCCKKYFEGDPCPWCGAVLVLIYVPRDRLISQLKQ